MISWDRVQGAKINKLTPPQNKRTLADVTVPTYTAPLCSYPVGVALALTIYKVNSYYEPNKKTSESIRRKWKIRATQGVSESEIKV